MTWTCQFIGLWFDSRRRGGRLGATLASFISALQFVPAYSTSTPQKSPRLRFGLLNEFRAKLLRDDVVHDVAVNIGQPEIATGIAVGQPFVIETQ